MIAFHGNAELKAALVEEIKWHQEQDRITQGTYGDGCSAEEFRGCAVGCSINSLNRRQETDWDTSNHRVYETELGIPLTLAYLEDRIFEGLTEEKAREFPLRFMEAIPVGADLSSVFPRMMIFILKDCRPHARPDGQVAIDRVIALFEKTLAGGEVSTDEWWSAAAARAAAAAWDEAWHAAYERYADEFVRLLAASSI